nr:zf-BED domain-containing protein [Tanacetum cinerariifolium]
MFAEAVILIDDRLIKHIDITLEQWLDLKFRDHKKVDKEIMKEVLDGINTEVEFDPTDIEFAKWLASKFNKHKTMDRYTKNALWLYWIRGDDEEVLTDDVLSDLEEENLRNMTYFQNYEWYEGFEDDDLKNEALKEKAILEGSWGHENRHGMNFFSWLKECFSNYQELDYELMKKLEEYWWGKKEEEELSEDAWSNYSPNNDNDTIYVDQERFDNHEPMEEDDDDIRDLEDYLIAQDASYYFDEEEERIKERKDKLPGIPYDKPPTFKSKKFEVIKYSLGPSEEYIAIKEYEYDIWVRTK